MLPSPPCPQPPAISSRVATSPPACSPATCLDPSKEHAIDVMALSVGLPDGRYFAGKQLTPWMAFKDRIRLSEVEHRHDRLQPANRERYQRLKAAREGESVVLRWDIEGGLPSAPEPLWCVRQADMDHDRRPYAYLWGDCGHVDVYQLGHRLLLETPGVGDRPAMSTNRYIDGMMALMKGFGETWVLPAAKVVALVTALDLRDAARVFGAAWKAADAAGVDILAELAAMRGDPS